MSKIHLAFKYGLFAVLATLANLLAQELSSQVYAGAYSLIMAMIAGTLAGWISKYLLDKHYIFQFKTSSAGEEMNKFMSYGLIGILTTLLFWGFELSFEFWLGTKSASYTGAVIGLAIGYGVKYQLDKRYVFPQQDH